MAKVLTSMVLILASTAVACRAGEAKKGTLAQAQGKWARNMESEGKTYRMVKDIEGNKETVTVYEGEKVVWQWAVDFEIHKTKSVTMFTFRNMTFKVSPQPTEKVEGPTSYLFQIRDNKWYEIHGMMNGDQGKPELNVYEKVKQ